MSLSSTVQYLLKIDTQSEEDTVQTRSMLVTYSRRVTNGGSRSGNAATTGMWRRRRRRRKKRRWMEKLSEMEAGLGKAQG